jgi:uncharacterized protein
MDPALLDILACPICKGALQFDRERNRLLCNFDKLAYPIRDNVPVLLSDQAESLTLDHQEEA